jgi:hypothetical protein
MREQREYRYRLAGNDFTRGSEEGSVDGTDNDNQSDDENKNKGRDRDRDKKKDKSKWLTSKGFQYPALKTKKEDMTHPKRPPDSTIENLRKPWCDVFLPFFHPCFLPLSYLLSSFLPSFLSF